MCIVLVVSMGLSIRMVATALPGISNMGECWYARFERSTMSRSICVPDYFHFQPDTPDTPERHPHYTTRMTTSINSESIITNTVGSIDFIAVASDT